MAVEAELKIREQSDRHESIINEQTDRLRIEDFVQNVHRKNQIHEQDS